MSYLDEIEEREDWRRHDDGTWPAHIGVRGDDFAYLLRVARAAEKADIELQREYPSTQYAVDEALAELHDALNSLSRKDG